MNKQLEEKLKRLKLCDGCYVSLPQTYSLASIYNEIYIPNKIDNDFIDITIRFSNRFYCQKCLHKIKEFIKDQIRDEINNAVNLITMK